LARSDSASATKKGARGASESRTYEEPLPIKAEQELPCNAKRLNITWADQTLAGRKAQNPFGGWAGCHVSFYRWSFMSTDIMQLAFKRRWVLFISKKSFTAGRAACR